ncbi:hypothetical protein BKA64DRAFT_644433 [Cadophora sp. MPI-SDFR-AT-0126]|nr:hypothetical protein BKA64DRAFT_644433 [Leotiomycetes sp. MPI-SDFR-AT-0126]
MYCGVELVTGAVLWVESVVMKVEDLVGVESGVGGRLRTRRLCLGLRRLRWRSVGGKRGSKNGYGVREARGSVLARQGHESANGRTGLQREFPTEASIEELLDPLLRKEIAAAGCRGTRDMPVILEEDEGDTPDHTADSEATSTSINAGPAPASERSQRADPSNCKPWWDVGEGCFVCEDLHPLPLLDHEGLESTPTQDQPPSRRHSLGVSQDQSKPHGDNRTTRSWSEELRSNPRLCSQDMEKESPREQEQEEMAAGEISHKVLEQELEEADDDVDSGKREQRGEKRQHQDGGINSGIHHSESSGHGHDTNDDDDENDEEDENPRPTKQRRLLLASPDMPPTPALEQSSPKPHLARPHNVKPSSTTHFEMTMWSPRLIWLTHPSVNNDHHYTPPRSRSSPDTEKSASGEEYQECPLQGFLKRITIGDQITYNLEFSLSHVPEHLCPHFISFKHKEGVVSGCYSLSPCCHFSQAGQGIDEESRGAAG